MRISHSPEWRQSSWLIISHCTESVSHSLTPITSRAFCDAKTASDISYMHVALRISKSTLTHFIHVNQLSSLVIHVRVLRIYWNIQIYGFWHHLKASGSGRDFLPIIYVYKTFCKYIVISIDHLKNKFIHHYQL